AALWLPGSGTRPAAHPIRRAASAAGAPRTRCDTSATASPADSDVAFGTKVRLFLARRSARGVPEWARTTAAGRDQRSDVPSRSVGSRRMRSARRVFRWFTAASVRSGHSGGPLDGNPPDRFVTKLPSPYGDW